MSFTGLLSLISSSSCFCKSFLFPWLAYSRYDRRVLTQKRNSLMKKNRRQTCAFWNRRTSMRPFSSNTSLKFSSVRLFGGKNSGRLRKVSQKVLRDGDNLNYLESMPAFLKAVVRLLAPFSCFHVTKTFNKNSRASPSLTRCS